MEPKTHLIVSAIIAAILWPFFGPWALLALVSGWLIDFDHYLLHVWEKRNLSLREAIRNMRTKHGTVLCIFHTVEAFVVMVILAVYYREAVPALIGFMAHGFMDQLQHMQSVMKQNIYYADYFWLRFPSILLWPFYVYNKKSVMKEAKHKRCALCGFDDVLVPIELKLTSKKRLLLCPNHRAMLAEGIISEDEILRQGSVQKK